MGRPAPMLAAAITLVLSGCSLIASDVGGLADSPSGTYEAIPASKIPSLPLGDEIRLVVRSVDGERGILGRWRGRTRLSPSDAESTYVQWRTRTRTAAPEWGDSLEVDLGARGILRGRFHGFDREWIGLDTQGTRVPVALGLVREITRVESGIVVQGDSVRVWMDLGDLPLASGYAIEIRRVEPLESPPVVPLQQIVRVETMTNDAGRRVGAIVGAVADALIVRAVLLNNLKD